jgi:putative tryptophan/tyrosine transport system substrate-binding protein
MKRRDFIGTLVSAAIWQTGAQAQQGGKLPRVGYIDGEPRLAAMEGLLSGLHELGYVEGQNIRLIKQLFAAPTVGQTKEAILTVLPKVDILVVAGTVGGVAAKAATSDVPVVFISVGAPVDIGLVRSLAKPGGNMTGVTFEAAEKTYAKRLQLLTEIVPGVSRVAVLGATGDPNFPFAMVSLKQSAPDLGVLITPIELNSVDELERAFDEMKQAQAQALLVVSGSLTYASIRKTADLALIHRLPSCHGFWEAVAAGGLISLGPDLLSLGRQSARLVDKIIRGERPEEIPVEQPARYVTSINLRTAKTLGLTVPPSLLARAEEVIE